MKITKKLIVPMLAALMIAAMSCEENLPTPDSIDNVATGVLGDSTMTDDWEVVTAADLPQTVRDYVADTYSGETIKESWLTDEGEYFVVLNRKLILIFDSQGVFIEEYDHKEHRGDRDPIDLTDLPQVILDYVTSNYPDEEIDKAFVNEKGEYILKLDACLVLIFDANGNFIEEHEKERKGDDEEIDPSTLPQVILDYIATNYPDDTIDEASFHARREHFIVELASDLYLIFDAEGNFLRAVNEDEHERERERKEGRDKDHDEDGKRERKDERTEVAQSDLPQAITQYLTENYAGDPFEKAYFNASEQNYIVKLESEVVLIFDINGTFVRVADSKKRRGDKKERESDHEEITVDQLPQAILDYLAANYPNDAIEEAYFSASKGRYIVELESDLYVIFDQEGNFIKVKND